jgi:MraZ protein
MEGGAAMTGQYAHNIDAKGRLFIPARLREELGQTFHVTVGMDHCLSIYSDESWAAFTDKVRSLPYSKAKALRPLFANAVDCEPDGQGRILIPAKLREYADLQKEVVVIGSFDRAEIWNAERWAREEAMAFDSGSLEQAMEEMGL